MRSSWWELDGLQAIRVHRVMHLMVMDALAGVVLAEAPTIIGVELVVVVHKRQCLFGLSCYVLVVHRILEHSVCWTASSCNQLLVSSSHVYVMNEMLCMVNMDTSRGIIIVIQHMVTSTEEKRRVLVRWPRLPELKLMRRTHVIHVHRSHICNIFVAYFRHEGNLS